MDVFFITYKKDTFVIDMAALQASRVSWIGLNWKSMIKWN